MLKNITTGTSRQKIIVYIVLTVMTLAVYAQVIRFDFVNFDDNVYVTQNSRVLSGLNIKSVSWAFFTTYAEFWHPVTWLSLMLDSELYGLYAGGYHLTNLLLHILSTLLLFWFLSRATGTVWRCAFVAAMFALHPLHVESVAWIAERKDVLSGFFWMLTLCFYVYYTDKPALIRYLPVLASFVLALISKPMVVTLPVILILLDYWPLKRFEQRRNNLISWQLKEKMPFLLLAAFFSVTTVLAQYNPTVKSFSFVPRMANVPVAYVTYLGKILWPRDLAMFYPFLEHLPLWQVSGAVFLFVLISITVTVKARSLPSLFVGWFWYVITLLPVIGIIQVGKHAMADRFTYLPLIGTGMILAWGLPLLLRGMHGRKKILLPAAIAVMSLWVVLTWQQCGYWENSIKLFNRALRVTKNNYLAHNNLGLALFNEGKTDEAIAHYNKALSILPFMPDHILVYSNRGVAYAKTGRYQKALDDFNKAIDLKSDYEDAYSNRGIVYSALGQHALALEDFNRAIQLKPDYADFYSNRGVVLTKLGRYQNAIDDFSKAMDVQPGYVDALYKRAVVYLQQGNREAGCLDAQKACEVGHCSILKSAQSQGDCP